VAASHLERRDMGGALVVVGQMCPPAAWEWGGPDWRLDVTSDVSTGIVGCELQAEDPEAMSARWAEVLGLARDRTAGGWRLATEGGEIRFVAAQDGRGDGLAAFDVAVRDPADVQARAAARG